MTVGSHNKCLVIRHLFHSIYYIIILRVGANRPRIYTENCSKVKVERRRQYKLIQRERESEGFCISILKHLPPYSQIAFSGSVCPTLCLFTSHYFLQIIPSLIPCAGRFQYIYISILPFQHSFHSQINQTTLNIAFA